MLSPAQHSSSWDKLSMNLQITNMTDYSEINLITIYFNEIDLYTTQPILKSSLWNKNVRLGSRFEILCKLSTDFNPQGHPTILFLGLAARIFHVLGNMHGFGSQSIDTCYSSKAIHTPYKSSTLQVVSSCCSAPLLFEVHWKSAIITPHFHQRWRNQTGHLPLGQPSAVQKQKCFHHLPFVVPMQAFPPHPRHQSNSLTC